jgi:hypothetical protein
MNSNKSSKVAIFKIPTFPDGPGLKGTEPGPSREEK